MNIRAFRHIQRGYVSQYGFTAVSEEYGFCGLFILHPCFAHLSSYHTGIFHHLWGIGLHYVNKVLRLHNGRIRVKSKPGILTTFQVVIPLALEPERRFLWKKLK